MHEPLSRFPRTRARWDWLRSMLAIVGAALAGSAVMFGLQWGNYLWFPPPPGLDYNDPAHLERIVAAMPLEALLMLEVSYALGCLVAGAVVGRLASQRPTPHALVVGLIFTLLWIVNLTEFPAPVWLAVLVTVTYVPATLFGARIVSRRIAVPPAYGRLLHTRPRTTHNHRER